jgi:hypothetical protein
MEVHRLLRRIGALLKRRRSQELHPLVGLIKGIQNS